MPDLRTYDDLIRDCVHMELDNIVQGTTLRSRVVHIVQEAARWAADAPERQALREAGEKKTKTRSKKAAAG